MARGDCTFRQRDMTAALKAAAAAGCQVQRIKVDKEGTIVLVIADEVARPPPSRPGDGEVNEWDPA